MLETETNDTGPLNESTLTLSNAAPKPRATRSDKGKAKPKPPAAAEVLIARIEERIAMLDGAVPDHIPGHAKRLTVLVDELKRAVGGGK